MFNSTRDILPSERIGHNFPHGHQNRLCDHNSESALRDGRQDASFAEFRFGGKIPPRACVLVHRQPYPPVGRRYLFAWGSEPPARPQFRISTSTSRRSPLFQVGLGYLFAWGTEPPARPQFKIVTSTRWVNGRIRRFPVRRPNSSRGARWQAADAIAYGHRFAQTGITFRSVIGIAYKTPIRNRHSEVLDSSLLPQAIRRHFGVEKPSSDSLDYAIRWRSPHAEPPSHSDRMSCSTRHEISSPGRGYGCPNIADIVTPTVATPSITRFAGGAHTRSRPVTAIGSRVQLDARSPPQVVDMGARTSPI
ncbi:hypothetical protein Taro_055287 [Colocasia esculenta]|uniref:Uncharacterized protein n=1 Tax=Colocasia esculenta TaxID=4460 RepID=A0A843XTT1_COLES|nr:hypothetical protein [Colocasia esculenta]